jgi:uncharacterized short protein YbdD (DUF466 family)
MLLKLKHQLTHMWHIIRQLSGDDAYAQYLKHHADFHVSSVDAPTALSRKDFYKLWQDRKWTGIKRCC